MNTELKNRTIQILKAKIPKSNRIKFCNEKKEDDFICFDWMSHRLRVEFDGDAYVFSELDRDRDIATYNNSLCILLEKLLENPT